MSIEDKAQALATKVGEDIRALRATVGTLSELTTVNKSSLVEAIEELGDGLQALQDLEAANNGLIDDDVTTGVRAWSSEKIVTALQTAKDEILNGTPEAFSTLKEIADYLTANDAEISNLLTNLGGTVRVDAEQDLSGIQQQQACDNVGLGDNATSFREMYLIASDVNTYMQPGYVVPGYYA